MRLFLCRAITDSDMKIKIMSHKGQWAEVYDPLESGKVLRNRVIFNHELLIILGKNGAP